MRSGMPHVATTGRFTESPPDPRVEQLGYILDAAHAIRHVGLIVVRPQLSESLQKHRGASLPVKPPLMLSE